jgi:hypothetical protein
MSDPQTPSVAASLLSTYSRFVNPKLTCERLPRSLRPHPRNPDRPLTAGSKWDVLFHLLGSAADALQKAYAQDLLLAQKKATKESVEALICILEQRVVYIEKLVVARPENWSLDGTADTGYFINIR